MNYYDENRLKSGLGLANIPQTEPEITLGAIKMQMYSTFKTRTADAMKKKDLELNM